MSFYYNVPLPIPDAIKISFLSFFINMEINGEPKPNFSVRKKNRKNFISCEPEGEDVENVF